MQNKNAKTESPEILKICGNLEIPRRVFQNRDAETEESADILKVCGKCKIRGRILQNTNEENDKSEEILKNRGKIFQGKKLGNRGSVENLEISRN